MTLKVATGPVALAAALLAAGTALGGVDIKTRTEGREGVSGRMRAQGNQLRMDTEAPPSGAGATSIVFDASKNLLRIYRHEDKSYFEIDEKYAEQIGAQMAEARKKMEEQLARMPPEQRAMMEKMMEGGALPFPPSDESQKRPPLDAKPTGETETVGGIPCTSYALTRGGEKKGDVCAASWNALEIEAADVVAVKKLGAFQSKLSDSFGASITGGEQPFELLERIDGFPLRTRRMGDGQVVSTTYFEDITQVDVPADTFAVPAGYTKKQMGQPGG